MERARMEEQERGDKRCREENMGKEGRSESVDAFMCIIPPYPLVI